MDENQLIYFDNAATSWPKPENVYGYMMDFYRATGVNPGRSGFDLAIEAGSLLDKLRARLTRFFGGDQDAPERLCFGYNATDALQLIINGLLGPGDHVVTTHLEHNSVLRPINHLVRDGGVSATFVPFDGAGFVDPDAIARAHPPRDQTGHRQPRLQRHRHHPAGGGRSAGSAGNGASPSPSTPPRPPAWSPSICRP